MPQTRRIVKKLKVKQQDGTLSEYIHLGAEAQDVKLNAGKNLETKMQEIDTSIDTLNKKEIPIDNNLTSTNPKAALGGPQGKVLDDKITKLSTDTTKAISASEQKLTDQINAVDGKANAATAALTLLNNPDTGVSGSIANIILEAKKALFPIGYIYLTMNATNPQTVLGFGTWVRIAQGRTLVGVNDEGEETDPLFGTVEKSGGATSVKIAKENIPNYELTVTDPGHRHGYTDSKVDANTAQTWDINKGNWSVTSVKDKATSATTASAKTGITVNSGGSGTNLDIVNPYLTCYIWKRTA